MKKPFGKKSEEKEEESKVEKKSKETALVDIDYNRKRLFKKGVNLMADEKLEDAITLFLSKPLELTQTMWKLF